jgi:4'-phosphopantetheinyl transferase EntD
MRAETQRYGRAALRVLVKALRSKSERLRIVAAGMLLDRGFGKPAQALTGADGAPLIPSTVLVGLMGAAPISDALRAAQVYAEIIGNPGMDLEHVRFEPPADEVSGVPIGTAAPAPVAAPVEPVPVDLPATQEAPPWE